MDRYCKNCYGSNIDTFLKNIQWVPIYVYICIYIYIYIYIYMYMHIIYNVYTYGPIC